MNDVGRMQGEIHGSPGRYVELVCGDDAVLGIAELPPPLVSDHLDLQRVRRRFCLRLEDSSYGRDGDKNQNDRRDQRPENLEIRAAVSLRWPAGVAAMPVTQD